MHIQINGTATDMPDALSARELVERLELGGKRIALEINGEIIPRSGYAQHHLKDGDRVEIVHAIGGG